MVPELVSSTLDSASWIVVERPGETYAGAMARLDAAGDRSRLGE